MHQEFEYYLKFNYFIRQIFALLNIRNRLQLAIFEKETMVGCHSLDL